MELVIFDDPIEGELFATRDTLTHENTDNLPGRGFDGPLLPAEANQGAVTADGKIESSGRAELFQS